MLYHSSSENISTFSAAQSQEPAYPCSLQDMCMEEFLQRVARFRTAEACAQTWQGQGPNMAEHLREIDALIVIYHIYISYISYISYI